MPGRGGLLRKRRVGLNVAIALTPAALRIALTTTDQLLSHRQNRMRSAA